MDRKPYLIAREIFAGHYVLIDETAPNPLHYNALIDDKGIDPYADWRDHRLVFDGEGFLMNPKFTSDAHCVKFDRRSTYNCWKCNYTNVGTAPRTCKKCKGEISVNG